VVNRKRKRVAAGEEEQLAENDDDFGEEESRRMNDPDRDTLWRVNHDEFNRRFRHLMCIALVAEKVCHPITILQHALRGASSGSPTCRAESQWRGAMWVAAPSSGWWAKP
jgi:hypothetical protein